MTRKVTQLTAPMPEVELPEFEPTLNFWVIKASTYDIDHEDWFLHKDLNIYNYTAHYNTRGILICEGLYDTEDDALDVYTKYCTLHGFDIMIYPPPATNTTISSEPLFDD